MASLSPVKVNDLVKVDGSIFGRVVDIIQPLNTFNVFVVKTEQGEIQVPRFRIRIVPETIASAPPTTFVDIDHGLTQSVINDLMKDDFFDGPASEPIRERFHEVNDEDIDYFLAQNENENTMKKTFLNLKVVSSFLTEKLNENRAIEDIPPTELNHILCKFFIGVRKVNGREYEPSSLVGFRGSLERYLRKKAYGHSLVSSTEFSKLREVIKSKTKSLKKQGKGNLPFRAEPVSKDEIKILRKSGQLGIHSPESILNTLWWNNTIFFGLRSITPHRRMTWGDVQLKCDSSNTEYLEYSERQSKTRTGVDPAGVRDVTPRAWAQPNDPTCCPVEVYKKFASLRPSNFSQLSDPFYLATNTRPGIPPTGEAWFKRQPVGKNKLGSLMKTMATKANLSAHKRITNHSARKHMISTLTSNGVPAHQVMQVSGHKNIQSINMYSKITEEQHRDMSNILSMSNSNPNALVPVPNPAQCVVPHSSKGNARPTSYPSSSITMSSQKHDIDTNMIQTLFAGPIYGGVFNITVGGEKPGQSHVAVGQKRRRILPVDESSSDSE